jgi:hypothetical protein
LARTFERYDHVDCFNYMDAHDLLKLYRHGYSKVTDHACREIRHGRITRGQGEWLVHRHEQEGPRYLDLFCNWLGITRGGLRFLMDRFRNRLYWEEVDLGQWKFRGWSVMRTGDTCAADIQYLTTSELTRGEMRDYVVVGKGWP